MGTGERRDCLLVVVELGPGRQVGPLVEVHPGVRVAKDAAGAWVRVEIDGTAARVARQPVDPAGAPPQAAAGSQRAVGGMGAVGRTQAAGQTRAGGGAHAAGEVTVHSDGGCLGNPGPGGWAARLRFADGRVLELGGSEPHTTNNRMELTAAIEGLKAAQTCSPVTVVTDSEYLRRGITEWIRGWKRRDWLTAAKEPVLNQDLWQELDRLNRPDVRWRHTAGHAGDPDNERCDQLAREFASGRQPPLAGQ